ncbi:hypothetical protein [Rhodanobacter soli]
MSLRRLLALNVGAATLKTALFELTAPLLSMLVLPAAFRLLVLRRLRRAGRANEPAQPE